MNIFYLSENPRICALYHCDKHVVKMILESAQMLCTARHEAGLWAPYKSSFKNHPCTLWVRESLANYYWLCKLAFALVEEHQFRFNPKKPHKSLEVLTYCYEEPFYSHVFPSSGLTEPAQAMPGEYRDPNPIKAYRAYYMGPKRDIAKWRKRPVPNWFK